MLNTSDITFKIGYSRKISNPLLYKRVFDVVFSIIFLVIALPISLLIMVFIKMTSKGPVFYIQERVGLNGTVFKMLKFRTMTEAAEKNGPIWAKNNDPRVTKIGGLLRDAGLDEIPQFINVLKNEMSIIGPRPERPFFVNSLKKNIPGYTYRQKLKPGITGLAQIKYGNDKCEDDVKRKIKFDCLYINNMSASLDVYIVLQTILLLAKKFLHFLQNKK